MSIIHFKFTKDLCILLPFLSFATETIDKYEHPIMLYPGQAGLLLQNIQCYPPGRFIWYKRGKPLDLLSDRYSVSPSGSLGIRRIRSTDMGVYTLKLQMGDEMKDTGVQVAAAVDGVDFTEWQGKFSEFVGL